MMELLHGDIDILLRGESAETETQRAVRELRVETHRAQHVGRLQAGRGAGGAAGYRETVQCQHQGFTVDAGHVLVDQGDAGREAFVVIEGTATVKRNGRKVGTLSPGDAIGELALLDHGPRTATVTADTELTALVLSAREFAGIIEDVPGLAQKLLAQLAARVRELDRQIYG